MEIKDATVKHIFSTIGDASSPHLWGSRIEGKPEGPSEKMELRMVLNSVSFSSYIFAAYKMKKVQLSCNAVSEYFSTLLVPPNIQK